jgi:hypothetical protein
VNRHECWPSLAYREINLLITADIIWSLESFEIDYCCQDMEIQKISFALELVAKGWVSNYGYPIFIRILSYRMKKAKCNSLSRNN